MNGSNLNFAVTLTLPPGGNWLLASPTGNNQINVVLNGLVLQTLTAGTYQGTVMISQLGASPINIPVTLTVSPEPPVTISPTTVNLNYQIGGLNNQGVQQTVTLATTSTTPLPFAFGQPSVGNNPSGRNWVLVNPTSGTIPAGGNVQSTISYDSTANLPAGDLFGIGSRRRHGRADYGRRVLYPSHQSVGFQQPAAGCAHSGVGLHL